MTVDPIATPRGIRNCNPGNIRFSGHIKWLGQSGEDDKGFVIFTTPFWGLRALCRLLINYASFHRCRDVADFVVRFAPPDENETESYACAVSERLGIQLYEDLKIPHDIPALAAAIIWQENGQCPYPSAQIEIAMPFYPVSV